MKGKKTKTRTKSKTGKKFKKSTLKTLHTTTHCKNCDCSWSYWTCQAWKWQMASLLWVYRYIDIDNVYVHSTVYLWKKNVKTLAIIKWLHHANRISFFKPLKHNMNLVERITLDLFGITKKTNKKRYPHGSQDFIRADHWHPCCEYRSWNVCLKRGTKSGMEK